MNIYEIRDASGGLTFKAPDTKIAALTTMLIGRKVFGAKLIEGEGVDIPNPDTDEFPQWWAQETDEEFQGAGDRNRLAVADALQTVCIGDREDRRLFDDFMEGEATHAEKETFARSWASKKGDDTKLMERSRMSGRLLQLADEVMNENR